MRASHHPSLSSVLFLNSFHPRYFTSLSLSLSLSLSPERFFSKKMSARILSTTSVTFPGRLGVATDCQKLFPASYNAGRPRKSPSTSSKIYCMKTWNPINNGKFETLSYLPPLSDDSIAKEVDYIIANGWIPCLEFDEEGHIHRTNSRIPGYYDGRYWTLWKLPMFGCTDAAQVLNEIRECKATYPNAYIRCLAFDNKNQVQCMAFVIQKPN